MLIRIFILIYWQLAYDRCLRKWSCFYDPWEPKSLNESFLSLYQELIRVVNRVQQKQLSGMWLSYSHLFHNNVVLYLLIIWALVTQVQETVLINMAFHILPRKSQSYSSKFYALLIHLKISFSSGIINKQGKPRRIYVVNITTNQKWVLLQFILKWAYLFYAVFKNVKFQ